PHQRGTPYGAETVRVCHSSPLPTEQGGRGNGSETDDDRDRPASAHRGGGREQSTPRRGAGDPAGISRRETRRTGSVDPPFLRAPVPKPVPQSAQQHYREQARPKVPVESSNIAKMWEESKQPTSFNVYTATSTMPSTSYSGQVLSQALTPKS